MAECCDEEDEDGFIPYERKSLLLNAMLSYEDQYFADPIQSVARI